MSIAWSHESLPSPRPRLGWITAVILGAALGMASQSCEGPGQLAGSYAQTTAPQTLAQNTLLCADHECPDGYFAVGEFSIAVPRNSVMADLLRERRNQVVRITIEIVEPKQLQVIR